MRQKRRPSQAPWSIFLRSQTTTKLPGQVMRISTPWSRQASRWGRVPCESWSTMVHLFACYTGIPQDVCAVHDKTSPALCLCIKLVLTLTQCNHLCEETDSTSTKSTSQQDCECTQPRKKDLLGNGKHLLWRKCDKCVERKWCQGLRVGSIKTTQRNESTDVEVAQPWHTKIHQVTSFCFPCPMKLHQVW